MDPTGCNGPVINDFDLIRSGAPSNSQIENAPRSIKEHDPEQWDTHRFRNFEKNEARARAASETAWERFGRGLPAEREAAARPV